MCWGRAGWMTKRVRVIMALVIDGELAWIRRVFDVFLQIKGHDDIWFCSSQLFTEFPYLFPFAWRKVAFVGGCFTMVGGQVVWKVEVEELDWLGGRWLHFFIAQNWNQANFFLKEGWTCVEALFKKLILLKFSYLSTWLLLVHLISLEADLETKCLS